MGNLASDRLVITAKSGFQEEFRVYGVFVGMAHIFKQLANYGFLLGKYNYNVLSNQLEMEDNN